MDEPPNEAIINDDDALDGFLRNRKAQREKEERDARLEANRNTGGKGKGKHYKLI